MEVHVSGGREVVDDSVINMDYFGLGVEDMDTREVVAVGVGVSEFGTASDSHSDLRGPHGSD